SFFERLARKVMLNYVPPWIQSRTHIKTASYRPQITWLPLAPNHGTGSVLPQKPSKRYQEQIAHTRARSASASTGASVI
ncbi:hypothetical protein BGZ65_001236, partial [Modicella reniformis]